MIWMILLAVVLGLQLVVMGVAIKCDIRHDKQTKVDTPDRKRAQWWYRIEMGVLFSFVLGAVFEVIAFLVWVEDQSYVSEDQVKCETIDGTFSKRRQACYKDGIRITFKPESKVYGEE